jgi:hypothetical protein
MVGLEPTTYGLRMWPGQYIDVHLQPYMLKNSGMVIAFCSLTFAGVCLRGCQGGCQNTLLHTHCSQGVVATIIFSSGMLHCAQR